jgi:hypothetical protein
MSVPEKNLIEKGFALKTSDRKMRETRLERWHWPHHDSKASALSLTQKNSNPSYTVSTDTVTGTGFNNVSNTTD